MDIQGIIANLQKMNKFGGLTFLNFKTHCKAIIINTVCYFMKMGIKINRINLRIWKSSFTDNLSLTSVAMLFSGEGVVVSNNDAWTTECPHVKE